MQAINGPVVLLAMAAVVVLVVGVREWLRERPERRYWRQHHEALYADTCPGCGRSRLVTTDDGRTLMLPPHWKCLEEKGYARQGRS